MIEHAGYKIELIVMGALFYHTAFVAIYLFSRSDKPSRYSNYLAFVFLTLSSWYFNMSLENLGVFADAPWLLGWPTLITPFFIPFIYFYVKAISQPGTVRSFKHYWPHLIFPIAITLLGLPFLLEDGTVKALQLPGALDSTEQSLTDNAVFISASIANILQLVQGAGYILMAVWQLQHHSVRIRDYFSSLENRTLHWLRNFLVIMALFLCLGLLDYSPVPQNYSWILHLILISSFSFLSLRQEPVFKDVKTSNDLYKQPSKRTKTVLEPERRDRVSEKLSSAMTVRKLYENPDLTLTLLSQKTGVSRHHISETLREAMGCNFYDFVNGYRIRQACQMLRDTNEPTIEIAFAVGFNSRSTFSSAFRKHTGTSPGAWKKTHLN